MSYRWMPIYVCVRCGKQEPADRWENVPLGIKWLPYGWVGSSMKHGKCYCDECAKIIENMIRCKYGESR